MDPPPARTFVLDPAAGFAPGVATWVAALADVRRGTLAAVYGLPDAYLDRTADGWPNSIASLLYHVACTELRWLFIDVLQQPFTDEVERWLPHPYTDAEGRLSPVAGEPLDVHVTRLAETRLVLLHHYRAMSPGEFRRVRHRNARDFTAEWVLYHLVEHEAHHRGQISAIRAALGA